MLHIGNIQTLNSQSLLPIYFLVNTELACETAENDILVGFLPIFQLAPLVSHHLTLT